MNVKSVIPDVGPGGFYQGFIKFLEVFVGTFIVGGLKAEVPVVQSFFGEFGSTQMLLVSGTIVGVIVWIINWVKTKTGVVETGTEAGAPLA